MGKNRAFLDRRVFIDFDVPTNGNRVFPVEDLTVDDLGNTHPFALDQAEDTPDLGHHSLTFRALPRFEKLFDAGKTTGDVTTGCRCTAGVEGTQRQLRAWLPDGLCGDNSNG